jgi:hypothetical protein
MKILTTAKDNLKAGLLSPAANRHCRMQYIESNVLAPDVEEHELIIFRKDKWGPEWEKNFPGTRWLLLKGVRGENKGRIGHLMHFESMEVRNTFSVEEGTSSEITQAAMEKILPVWQEFYKTTDFNTIYTDWLIE